MIIFAGGGSGGHIIPALALHEELPDRRAIFICSDRPLDSQLLSRENVPFQVVPAKPISPRPRGLIRFLQGWGPSVRIGRDLIRRARSEGHKPIVVATGGFVAAPIARAARAEGIPLILVNLDAVPGKANRLIARSATTRFSSLPVTGPSAKLSWKVVPPIVRRSALTITPPEDCRRFLGLDPVLNTLLVTGGSQGAISINQLVLRALREHPDAFRGWQVIHQTGRGEEAAVLDAYGAARIPARVQAFFDRMGQVWSASTLAVSRAGAGGVADAWAYHTPTLFLPNPYHRDEHQKFNAASLVQSGGARLVRDFIEPSLNSEGVSLLVALLADPHQITTMKSALQKLGPADGAPRIAEFLRAQLGA